MYLSRITYMDSVQDKKHNGNYYEYYSNAYLGNEEKEKIYIDLDIRSNNRINYYHYYNDIPFTKWPFLISNSVLFTILYGVMLLNKWINIYPLFILSFISLLFFTYLWLVDLVVESTWLGKYNRKLRAVIVAGLILFLASEVFLFGGFFWAYFDRFFHLPSVTGANSISLGIEVFVWYKKPLYGTIVLLFSTIAFNGANYSMKWGSYYYRDAFFAVGLFLGYLSLVIQATEYIHLSFNISDSVYSSCFYLLTGFHGFHVIIGLIFLTVQVWRFSNNHFTRERHLGLLSAMIYWHFVDIVWIFLFIFVYVCNNYGFSQFIIL